MRRMLIATFAVACVLGAAGCAGRLGAPTPLPAPESPAAQLFAAKCSGCHSAPHPRRHTYAQWQGIIEKMETHAGGALLTYEERAKVLGYLREHARQSRRPRDWREKDTDKAHRWED